MDKKIHVLNGRISLCLEKKLVTYMFICIIVLYSKIIIILSFFRKHPGLINDKCIYLALYLHWGQFFKITFILFKYTCKPIQTHLLCTSAQ